MKPGVASIVVFVGVIRNHVVHVHLVSIDHLYEHCVVNPANLPAIFAASDWWTAERIALSPEPVGSDA
jgi:hypothetical protein